MSDTVIHYKYKSKETNEEVIGDIICDRGVFKSYCGLYGDSELSKRLKHCSLIERGHGFCKPFLEDIVNWWNSDASGWRNEYEEKGREWYEFLKDQEITEILFSCY